MVCVAQPTSTASIASATLRLTVVIPPVFRVLQVAPVAGGHEYRVWTNTKSVVINGRKYHFDKVGEATLTVRTPMNGSNELFIVHGL